MWASAWHSAALPPSIQHVLGERRLCASEPLASSFLCPLLCLPDPEPLPLWAVYLNLFKMQFLGSLIDLGCAAPVRALRGEEEHRRDLSGA